MIRIYASRSLGLDEWMTGLKIHNITTQRLFRHTESDSCGNMLFSWWCHQMETFFALLALCVVNSPVTGEFPSHKPVTRSFDVFFDLRLNKPLSEQSWGWWFGTPSRSLWRHCNVISFFDLDITRCENSNSIMTNIIGDILSTSYLVMNKSLAKIPQCVRQISHNAQFCNRNVHICAHFCYKMVHRGVFVWCTVGFVRWVYCQTGVHIGLTTLLQTP